MTCTVSAFKFGLSCHEHLLGINMHNQRIGLYKIVCIFCFCFNTSLELYGKYLNKKQYLIKLVIYRFTVSTNCWRAWCHLVTIKSQFKYTSCQKRSSSIVIDHASVKQIKCFCAPRKRFAFFWHWLNIILVSVTTRLHIAWIILFCSSDHLLFNLFLLLLFYVRLIVSWNKYGVN